MEHRTTPRQNLELEHAVSYPAVVTFIFKVFFFTDKSRSLAFCFKNSTLFAFPSLSERAIHLTLTRRKYRSTLNN